MSQSMPVGPALEQLREVIAILRELGNAGPRNQSFKQWRQVTMTLLQRIWPGDQTRAGRFRRIPFSPPSARADAKTIRECYERGVCEAIAFLEGLVLELDNGAGKSGQKFVRPPEAPLRTGEERLESASSPSAVSAPPAPPTPAAPTPAPMEAGPIEPSPWNGPTAPAPSASAPVTGPASEPPPPPRAAEPVRPAQAGADAAKGAGRSRARLKDMLGFSDEAHEPAAAAHPGPAPRTEPRLPSPAPPLAAQPPAQVAQPPAPAVEPPSAPVIPFPSVTVRDGASGARAASPPPEPVANSGEEEFDAAFDLMEEMGAEAGPPPPATLREMLDRDPGPRPAAPSGAALAVRAMADKVDQLGVPPGRRAMVRATLIDLGRQLEAPPVEWAAIRQAFAFVMDYPQVARRVIPLLLPYLDEAA